MVYSARGHIEQTGFLFFVVILLLYVLIGRCECMSVGMEKRNGNGEVAIRREVVLFI